MATPAEQALAALARATILAASIETGRRDGCRLELQFTRNSQGLADMQAIEAYIRSLQPAPAQMSADERQWQASS